MSISSATSREAPSRPSIYAARRWATEEQRPIPIATGREVKLNGEEEGHQEKEEVRTLSVTGGGSPPSTSHQTGGGRPPSRLCLNDLRDFARLQTARADAHAFRAAADQRAHGHEIREPAATRQLVSVTYRVADRRAFAADITPLSHDHSSNCITDRLGRIANGSEPAGFITR